MRNMLSTVERQSKYLYTTVGQSSFKHFAIHPHNTLFKAKAFHLAGNAQVVKHLLLLYEVLP